MKTTALYLSLCLILILVLTSGCSVAPKTFKEITLDDMYPIMTEEEYHSLQSMNTDEYINLFLEQYWKERDSIPGALTKKEYLSRLAYANEHYPDRRVDGRSDRKKIYLQYGPPVSIMKKEFSDLKFETFSTIKSLEIWLYASPAGKSSLPTYADELYPGEKRFIFGDITGNGNYQILFSSEDGRDIDSRMYKHR
ncbi:MAG: GWxTD domain-containing protein [Bacteroidota bacterium]